MIRKARLSDIDAVEKIYDRILAEEEAGRASIGWQRGVYPTRQVALDALEKGTLFVLELDEAPAVGMDTDEAPAVGMDTDEAPAAGMDTDEALAAGMGAVEAPGTMGPGKEVAMVTKSDKRLATEKNYAAETAEVRGLQEGIAAAAKIDQEAVPIYRECKWEYPAPDSEVMILHTLVVDPELSGHGYGKQFVKFYEDYALENGCRHLHMDTNAINAAARKLYKGLGYKEVDILPCVFNGIEGVRLVCLEKKL